MFEASVDGEAYDADRWSQYFRPSGMQARTGDPTKAASNATATSQSAPVAPVAPTPVADGSSSGSSSRSSTSSRRQQRHQQ